MVETDLYEAIVRARRRGEPAALATIIGTQGSTPGKESMKMLVRGDGTFVGSVGGGCVEADVYTAAQEVLRTDRPRRLRFALNERDYPESGLICGGRLEIYVEPVTDPTLVLFGGGHVSSAVARVAREASFRVVVGDDRETFATTERFPDAAEVVAAPWDEQVARIAPAEHLYLLVVTRGHQDDGVVLRALHARGCRPKYLGMIGSRAKRAVLFETLEADGVPRAWLEGVYSPTGFAIGARSHGEIAVSIVAQLISLRRLGLALPDLSQGKALEDRAFGVRPEE